jgi:hypothetical protein
MASLHLPRGNDRKLRDYNQHSHFTSSDVFSGVFAGCIVSTNIGVEVEIDRLACIVRPALSDVDKFGISCYPWP